MLNIGLTYYCSMYLFRVRSSYSCANGLPLTFWLSRRAFHVAKMQFNGRCIVNATDGCIILHGSSSILLHYPFYYYSRGSAVVIVLKKYAWRFMFYRRVQNCNFVLKSVYALIYFIDSYRETVSDASTDVILV
jgi:hypothetical protein